MYQVDLTTPAVLISMNSLLMLAFTNRFLAITNRVRDLCAKYQGSHQPGLLKQINSLRKRMQMMRDMQVFCVLSLFVFVSCMFLVFMNQQDLARYGFVGGLICVLISLFHSTREIFMSNDAVNIMLNDLEQDVSR